MTMLSSKAETSSNNNNDSDHLSRRPVVFVDPLDYDAPYWWPALVVPNDELSAFKKQVGPFKGPKQNEIVVCYFENCSYSVISKRDTLPFSTSSRIYLSYSKGPNKDLFLKDQNVILATQYFETGKLPACFEWVYAQKKPPKRRQSTMSTKTQESSETESTKSLTKRKPTIVNKTQSDKCFVCLTNCKIHTLKKVCVGCCDELIQKQNKKENDTEDGLSSPNSNEVEKEIEKILPKDPENSNSQTSSAIDENNRNKDGEFEQNIQIEGEPSHKKRSFDNKRIQDIKPSGSSEKNHTEDKKPENPVENINDHISETDKKTVENIKDKSSNGTSLEQEVSENLVTNEVSKSGLEKRKLENDIEIDALEEFNSDPKKEKKSQHLNTLNEPIKSSNQQNTEGNNEALQQENHSLSPEYKN